MVWGALLQRNWLVGGGLCEGRGSIITVHGWTTPLPRKPNVDVSGCVSPGGLCRLMAGVLGVGPCAACIRRSMRQNIHTTPTLHFALSTNELKE